MVLLLVGVLGIILASAYIKKYFITLLHTLINLISAYLVALLNAVQLFWCASLQHRFQDLKWHSTHLSNG